MGFTFDGTASKSMGILTKMTKENRVPDLNNYTVEISGKNGLLDLGSSLSERVIEISCFILPKKTDAALLAAKDAIVDWLNPDKGVCALVLDTEPERVYYARLQDGVTFSKVVRRSSEFDLTFFCPDPFGYAIDDEVFEITEEGTDTVTRELGNVASDPVYLLQGVIGSSSSSYITITTNNSELKIAGASLTADEIFVVDTDKMTAYVTDSDGNILRNGLPYIDELNFPTLEVEDNTITIETNNATFTSLTIQAKSRWR